MVSESAVLGKVQRRQTHSQLTGEVVSSIPRLLMQNNKPT